MEGSGNIPSVPPGTPPPLPPRKNKTKVVNPGVDPQTVKEATAAPVQNGADKKRTWTPKSPDSQLTAGRSLLGKTDGASATIRPQGQGSEHTQEAPGSERAGEARGPQPKKTPEFLQLVKTKGVNSVTILLSKMKEAAGVQPMEQQRMAVAVLHPRLIGPTPVFIRQMAALLAVPAGKPGSEHKLEVVKLVDAWLDSGLHQDKLLDTNSRCAVDVLLAAAAKCPDRRVLAAGKRWEEQIRTAQETLIAEQKIPPSALPDMAASDIEELFARATSGKWTDHDVVVLAAALGEIAVEQLATIDIANIADGRVFTNKDTCDRGLRNAGSLESAAISLMRDLMMGKDKAQMVSAFRFLAAVADRCCQFSDFTSAALLGSKLTGTDLSDILARSNVDRSLLGEDGRPKRALLIEHAVSGLKGGDTKRALAHLDAVVLNSDKNAKSYRAALLNSPADTRIPQTMIVCKDLFVLFDAQEIPRASDAEFDTKFDAGRLETVSTIFHRQATDLLCVRRLQRGRHPLKDHLNSLSRNYARRMWREAAAPETTLAGIYRNGLLYDYLTEQTGQDEMKRAALELPRALANCQDSGALNSHQVGTLLEILHKCVRGTLSTLPETKEAYERITVHMARLNELYAAHRHSDKPNAAISEWCREMESALEGFQEAVGNSEMWKGFLKQVGLNQKL